MLIPQWVAIGQFGFVGHLSICKLACFTSIPWIGKDGRFKEKPCCGPTSRKLKPANLHQAGSTPIALQLSGHGDMQQPRSEIIVAGSNIPSASDDYAALFG